MAVKAGVSFSFSTGKPKGHSVMSGTCLWARCDRFLATSTLALFIACGVCAPVAAQTLQVIRPGAPRVGLAPSGSVENAPEEAFSSVKENKDGAADSDKTQNESLREPDTVAQRLQDEDRTVVKPREIASPSSAVPTDPGVASRTLAIRHDSAAGAECPEVLTSAHVRSLYASGNALVRFFSASGKGDTEQNKSSESGAVSFKIGLPETEVALEAGAVSAYRPLAQGSYTLSVSGDDRETSRNINLFPGTLYTVIAEGSRGSSNLSEDTEPSENSTFSITILQDPLPKEGKAYLTFYNLSDYEALALTAGERQTPLLSAVSRGVSMSLPLRPLDLRMGVKQSGARSLLADIAPLRLLEGRSYTVFATGRDEDVRAHAVLSKLVCGASW